MIDLHNNANIDNILSPNTFERIMNGNSRLSDKQIDCLPKVGLLILLFISLAGYQRLLIIICKMDEYIGTIIRVGGIAVGGVMLVCIIWYVVKDLWDTTHSKSRD